MITEEEHLIKQFGKQHPFRVPEGYFDNLTSEIMAKLPEQKAETVVMKPLWQRYVRTLAAVAASVAVVLVTVYTFTSRQNSSSNAMNASLTTEKSNSYTAIDEAVDYAMLDNEDMYAYVAGY